ncbi:hypothetical protein [Nocardia altamirensis]|uniref:hypothetical protein n=1 Tax=Nocardia altamirensis TaxID=472158 RepID=UPI0008406BDE|nr:hypothetical protein [Nocardia altamirensis]
MSMGDAETFTERYHRSGSSSDRDQAITAYRRERFQYDEVHDSWLSSTLSMRQLLLDRWRAEKAAADLNEIIDLNHDLLGDRRFDDEDRAILLWSQTTLLWQRSNQELSLDDLGRAVATGKDLAALTGDDHPDRLSSIGYMCQQRFHSTHESTDLDAAIELCRRSVRTPADDAAEQGRRLSNLFGALTILADETHEITDFDAAVEVARAAVALYPDGDPPRAQHLNNLAAALCGRFQRSGAEHDLDQSVRYSREAWRTAPNEQERLSYGATLLVTLAFRLDRFGDTIALDEALGLLKQGWFPEPSWLGSIRTLAEAVRRHIGDLSIDADLLNSLLSAYARGLIRMSIDIMDAGAKARDLRLIDGAGDLLATAEAISDTAESWIYQSLRGQLLIRRWQVSGARGNLDEAIELLLNVSTDPSAQHMAATHLKDAATALTRRFRRRRRKSDLEDAARYMARALALTDDSSEDRREMVEPLQGMQAHLADPPMLINHSDMGEADREDLNSPHGLANMNAWHRGEPRDSGLTWIQAGPDDHPVRRSIPSDPRVLFLRTFTADDASYVVLNSLAMALDGGVGRIDIVSDLRDRSEIERHWTTAFGASSPTERINFVASTPDGWRQEILHRIALTDVIVLHVSPKDVNFPEFPFGPPSTKLGGDGVWERIMDAPLSRPITGPGLLREVVYLNRLRRLPMTIVICDDRYQETLDDMIALSGLMGDATDLAGNFVTPRFAAIDKQLGHLHKAYRGLTYRRLEGAAVLPGLSDAISRTLADMRTADLTPPTLPWRPQDLVGRSPTPRRLPPDNQPKIIGSTDVEMVLFLPQGEITEIDHREVLTILNREAIATGCPYCRAPFDRMFFFVNGLWTAEKRAAVGTPDLLAKCQICGHKSSQMSEILMPQ